MPVPICDTPQYFLPSSANGISSNCAYNWGDGTWVELCADTGNDPLLLTCLVARCTYMAWGAMHYELELGVGSAGNEVPVATVYTWQGLFAIRATTGIWAFPFPLDVLPAHSRLVGRTRQSSPYDATTFNLCAGVQARPASPPEVQTAAIKTMPSRAGLIGATTNASAWTWGSWAQIVASTATAVDILGVWFSRPDTGDPNGWAELDIGTGGAGSEVSKYPIAEGTYFGAYSPEFLALRHPIHIPTGTRIAIRVRHSAASALGYAAALAYREAA